MASKAPKQYLFVSQRDITVTSVLGYAIEFKKGIPTHVPRAMHAEVMERGCIPVDSDGTTTLTLRTKAAKIAHSCDQMTLDAVSSGPLVR